MEKACEADLPLSAAVSPVMFDGETVPKAVEESDEEEKEEEEEEEYAGDAPPPWKVMGSNDDGEEGDDDEEEMEYDGEEEEAAAEEEEVEYEFYDSDGSEDDDDGEEVDPAVASAAQFVPEGQFLGPAQFAAYGRAAGFMRVAAVEADPPDGQEILVLYRYTILKRTWREPAGVEMSRWTKVSKIHRLRFIVPASGDPASSLPFAGMSLSPLIYHEDYIEELETLWSKLAVQVHIPPGATRVQVIVDVGILKPGDDTPERREYMRAELEAKKEVPWPGKLLGVELHVPEPVVAACKRDNSEVFDADVAPPAKRRKVVAAGEECPVCLDELEDGVVAWPGCSVAHVFHGQCLETTLRGSQMCPICRRDLGLKTLQEKSDVADLPMRAPSGSPRDNNITSSSQNDDATSPRAPLPSFPCAPFSSWQCPLPPFISPLELLNLHGSVVDYELTDDESGDEADEPTKARDGEAPAVRGELPLVPAPFVREGKFLGPARFATVGCTAGFMRVAVVEGGGGGREIVVLYRYTRYSGTWSGRKGVEMSRRTKLNRLRFVVPPAADMASSLAWAGSSLAPLIYPYFFSRELLELWSSLIMAAAASIPPGATRVEVLVDVGILRPFDKRPDRMEYMRRELEAKTEAAWSWPGHHVGLDLNLPEPVLYETGAATGEVLSDEGASPAKKRRRVVAGVAGEECPVCFFQLETDLVAWPGCSVRHVFHGECLEFTLERSDKCPICRKGLIIKKLQA
uniref:RING-type E3 ubiquitin transferase n=1 Tax=Oryza punctata TaxID=4537 RepID=A0A0E0LEW4_ORYPU